MLNQNMVSELRQFGLSEYEARTYLVLTINGASAASFVSEHTKIPCSKIYDILSSLKLKGLIEICETKPKKFKPVNPKYALVNLVNKKEIAMKRLRVKTVMIASKLKPPEVKENSEIWNAAGRKTFYAKASELIKRCGGYGFATTSNFSRYPYLDEEFSRAIKKGIKIKMLGTSELTEESRLRAAWYAKNGAEIRILPMDVKPVIGVVDGKEVVFRINSKIECDFMWSSNDGLVSIMQSYFEQLWKQAKPIQQYLLA